MDDALLSAIAREANGVAVSQEHAAAFTGPIAHINQRVADAALSRVGLTQPIVTFDTFRAPYAAAGEPERAEKE